MTPQENGLVSCRWRNDTQTATGSWKRPPQCYPLHSLVFPCYQPEQPTSLTRISPADALCRLTEAGYDMEGGLDTERVEELIDWIGGISCYELHIHDL